MSEALRFWLLVALSCLGLVLVAINIALYQDNRALQAETQSRNLFIQQSLQLERVYQPLVRGLAELAATRDDADLRELLAAEGIAITVRRSPAPGDSGAGTSAR